MPVTCGLLTVILAPPTLMFILKHAFPLPVPERTLLLSIYPSVIIALLAARLFKNVATLFQSWAQSIRDSEFLLEMRLLNLEAQKKEDRVKRQ